MTATTDFAAIKTRRKAAWPALLERGRELKAFAALDAQGQHALAADLLVLTERFDTARDGALVIPSAYLEIVTTRK